MRGQGTTENSRLSYKLKEHLKDSSTEMKLRTASCGAIFFKCFHELVAAATGLPHLPRDQSGLRVACTVEPVLSGHPWGIAT